MCMRFNDLSDSNLFNGKLSTVLDPRQPFGKPLLNKTTCPRDLSFPNVQLFIFDPPFHYSFVFVKIYNVFFFFSKPSNCRTICSGVRVKNIDIPL